MDDFLRMLHLRLFFSEHLLFIDVDPVVVEVLADEAIGAEAAKEHTLLETKLGGTRNNRLFAFFGIETPRRAAEARLKERRRRRAIPW